jgi:hypothetical protein
MISAIRVPDKIRDEEIVRETREKDAKKDKRRQEGSGQD